MKTYRDLQTELDELEDKADELRCEYVKQFESPGGRYKVTKNYHQCGIYVRGCDTERQCYCLAADGHYHTESEFPLVGKDGKTY